MDKEREEFLERIHSIPYWVINKKNENNWLEKEKNFHRFSRHLQYRLIQADKQLEEARKFLPEEVRNNLVQIYSKYEYWYNNTNPEEGFWFEGEKVLNFSQIKDVRKMKKAE